MVSIWKLLDGVDIVGKPVRAGHVETPGQLPTVIRSSNLRGVRLCAKFEQQHHTFWRKLFTFTEFLNHTSVAVYIYGTLQEKV